MHYDIHPMIGAGIPDDDAGPQDAVTYRGLVYPWQCDHMQHMNVMWYTGKFDEASWTLLSYLGITPRYLRDNQRKMAAVQQTTSYRREVFAGDALHIVSRLTDVREKALCFTHDMYCGEELVASSDLVGVHIDVASGRACALPAWVLQRVAPYLERKAA